MPAAPAIRTRQRVQEAATFQAFFEQAGALAVMSDRLQQVAATAIDETDDHSAGRVAESPGPYLEARTRIPLRPPRPFTDCWGTELVFSDRRPHI